MRKLTLMALIASIFCCLTGCTQLPPETAADGAAWSDTWVTVGNIVGADAPSWLEPKENMDVLSARGMYYATWASGEAVPYTDAEGDEAELYSAQLYLLLAGYDSAAKAEASASDWLHMASAQYNVTDTYTESHNGQEFTVITYTFSSETNPFAKGASAFGVYRNYAISVEFSCQEGFDRDELESLREFLENCHYAV
ncbi:MAG: hypothetical protein K2O18_02950 [Oscillospiraceae bacterium]|nr:hypothetical protein [Oscillospiraceae bacterium]